MGQLSTFQTVGSKLSVTPIHSISQRLFKGTHLHGPCLVIIDFHFQYKLEHPEKACSLRLESVESGPLIMKRVYA